MLRLIQYYLTTFQYNLHGAFMRHKLRRWNKLAVGRLLDVGTGDKPYRRFFSVDTYVGTNTKRHYGDKADAVEKHTDVWIDDAGSLPFADETFETVLCFQVLSVVEKPERFFAEAYRVLTPGGALLLTTDFLYAPWSAEDKARYTATRLKHMAAEAGFETVGFESFGGYRSLSYALQARYVRSYAGSIKQAKGIRRMLRAVRFLTFLHLVPAQSVRGWLAYQLEKNKHTETDFTFNYLLLARKPF